MIEEFNITLRRNSSHLITLILEEDYKALDYDFIYLVKKERSDKDTEAVISSIEVTSNTVNITDLNLTDSELEQFETDTVDCLQLFIRPEDTKKLDLGYYYHGLRIISPDKLTVLDLFEGKVNIINSIVEAP